MLKVVIALVILALIIKLIREFELLVVTGDSMYPTLKDGEIVLLHKTQDVQVDDIIIVTDSTISDKTIIKRVLSVTKIGGQKRYWIEGDNKEVSYDSRKFGYIKQDVIEGKIIRWKKTEK